MSYRLTASLEAGSSAYCCPCGAAHVNCLVSFSSAKLIPKLFIRDGYMSAETLLTQLDDSLGVDSFELNENGVASLCSRQEFRTVAASAFRTQNVHTVSIDP